MLLIAPFLAIPLVFTPSAAAGRPYPVPKVEKPIMQVEPLPEDKGTLFEITLNLIWTLNTTEWSVNEYRLCDKWSVRREGAPEAASFGRVIVAPRDKPEDVLVFLTEDNIIGWSLLHRWPQAMNWSRALSYFREVLEVCAAIPPWLAEFKPAPS